MKRFLIIQLARFGDLMQTVRLVRTLEAESPCEIHLCIDRSLTKLARLVYPEVRIHAIYAHGPGVHADADSATVLGHNRRVMEDLIGLNFAEVYNLNFSGLNFSLARLFDPAIVRGYRSEDGQPVKSLWADMAFRWIRMRAATGLNVADLWAWHAGRAIDPEKVNPPATPKGGGIGVVLAGRNQRRSLPPNILARIAAAVWSRNGKGKIYLLGSKGERGFGKELQSFIPRTAASETVNLAGRTDWQGLVDVVSGLDMLVTPDTGTMHLAAILGTPVTAFFLSSAWCFETGPYGDGHTVWQAMPSCAPCVESAPCGHKLACLDPFTRPEFLKLLVGGGGGKVSGIVGFSSGVDALGVVYRAFSGEDPWGEKRQRYRNFLALHHGLADAPMCPLDREIPECLYLERDWMGKPEKGFKALL